MIVIAANATRQVLHAMHGGQGMVHRPNHETEPPKEFIRRKMRRLASQGLSKTRHDRLEFPGKQLVHERQRIAQTATEDASEMTALISRFGGEFEQRANHDINYLGQGHRLTFGLFFRLFEPGQPGLVKGTKATCQHQTKEVFLVTKVVMGSRQVNSGQLGYFPEGCTIVATLGEKLFRGIQDTVHCADVQSQAHVQTNV